MSARRALALSLLSWACASHVCVAALAAGVDAGVTEFARYELRQTTSSNVFEAIPRDHIKAKLETGGAAQNGNRAIASKLLLALIESGWLDRLPYEPRDSKQKGKFIGLRGPIEAAIVQIGERPDDATRWQARMALPNSRDMISARSGGTHARGA